MSTSLVPLYIISLTVCFLNRHVVTRIGRYGHSSVVLSVNTVLVMGGCGNGGDFNEVWRSDHNEGSTWSLVTENAWSTGGEYSSSTTLHYLSNRLFSEFAMLLLV